MIVTVHAAKTQLSKLIEAALAGEEVVIARGAEPVVKLTPLQKTQPKRVFGALKGKLEIPEALLSPLPDDELEAWGQ